MKIRDIDYYVKFIFSTVSDTGECYSTTDRQTDSRICQVSQNWQFNGWL